MKKSFLIVAVIIVLIALLPIVGNTFIKSSLDSKVAELQTYGLEVKKDTTLSNYLHTSRHFEFYLKDSTEFVNYLEKYSSQQLPPYVNALVNGLVIGVDIKYSNIPFAKSQSMEIYPLHLSLKTIKSLQQNSPDFYTYLDKFLQSKGILYHINYNLINQNFDGYIKDIDELYTMKNGTKIKMLAHKLTFNGQGDILAPTTLTSKAKEFDFDVVDSNEQLNFSFNNFSSASNFESQNTYISSVNVKKMYLNIKSLNENLRFTMDNARFNGSSNDQEASTQLNSKASIEHMKLDSDRVSFEIKKFNIDAALSDLDKVLFDKLRTTQDQMIMKDMTAKLLSKGLALDIADFSIDNITIKEIGDLEGFELKLNFRLKPDSSLAQKVQQNPMAILSDIQTSSNIKISKNMFDLLLKSSPMASGVLPFAKEENNNYIFDINLSNSQATINGKKLN